MEAYLPKDSTGSSSPYAEGGGLYAIGESSLLVCVYPGLEPVMNTCV